MKQPAVRRSRDYSTALNGLTDSSQRMSELTLYPTAGSVNPTFTGLLSITWHLWFARIELGYGTVGE
jgi:hypothetical protein